MKQKMKYELHPVGEATFKIVRLVSKETKWTLIFAPTLKGYQSIPRTYSIYKESDLSALEEIGCKIENEFKIKKHLQNLVGKTVVAMVSEAKNEGFRNIDHFIVSQDMTNPIVESGSYINSTT